MYSHLQTPTDICTDTYNALTLVQNISPNIEKNKL